MSFYHIRSRERAIIHCSALVYPVYNKATAGACKRSNRGDEWSLRAFASMPSTAIFLRARAEIKKFALRAASSLESTTREQRALLIFSACSKPYGNPFL